jgi:electron transfer flavoprotein alpha subunit
MVTEAMNMMKTGKALVFAENTVSANELVAAARDFAQSVDLIFAGVKNNALPGDTAYCLDSGADATLLNSIGAITELLAQTSPGLVLVESTKNGLLVASAIAVALDCTVLTDISELAFDGTAFTAKRMVYGGAAFETVSVPANKAVAVVGAGVFEVEAAAAGTAAHVVELSDKGTAVTLLERRPRGTVSVNLATSKIIIGVGRGLGVEEDLSLIDAFAKTIDGAVGCTRPIAEEEKWMPRETYIGVSGVMLKPDVYIGVGVSGQIQHMVGVNQARSIVAINKDKNAPIFTQCDLGLVADLNAVIPRLTAMLS